MVYNKGVKDIWKWAKNIKICHFWPKLSIWPNNGIFWHFWPISINLWPICYTLLETVKFFWLFKTLKIKIHFFSQNFFKGSPLWILAFPEPTFWQMRQPISILDQNCFFTWHDLGFVTNLQNHLNKVLLRTDFFQTGLTPSIPSSSRSRKDSAPSSSIAGINLATAGRSSMQPSKVFYYYFYSIVIYYTYFNF